MNLEDYKIPKHDHTHSLYTHCLDCHMFGIGFPEEYIDLMNASECGNCKSIHTVKYYPACCMTEFRNKNKLIETLVDAQDTLWSILQSYGYKLTDKLAADWAAEHFDRFKHYEPEDSK